MFGIGGVEFLLIILFVFLIFGADRLPEIARVIGKAIAKFRKAQAEMNAAIQTDVKNLETDEQPFQKSVEAFDKFGKETVDSVKSSVKNVQKTNATAPAPAAAAKGGAPAKAASAPAPTAAVSATEGKLEKGAVATAAAAGAGLAASAAAAKPAGSAEPPKRESFTERKARYEAERAAKEAAAAAAAAAADGASASQTSAPVTTGEGE